MKKWSARVTATVLFVTGLLVAIILNPILTYAGKTTHNNFTIYHDREIDNLFLEQIDAAHQLISRSELYDKNLTLDICLNNGSAYAKLIETIGGRAFARGFYDKVVLFGEEDFNNNTVELSGYKRNLTQLLAHEMTHCLQFKRLGLWKSKPFANIPNWKWEGYAEYVARQQNDQKNLTQNIYRLLATSADNWEVVLSDSTITAREYYNYWILVQYCMDIRKMSYNQVLEDTTSYETLKNEMMNWYYKQNN